ncbi:sensor histidine kinase [Anaerosolibacter sp.]|uniref:sensor histidine kinase n=1 Tax=Anaerosolibacter sp. TaxID=1872527 RepID=UPI0039EF562C
MNLYTGNQYILLFFVYGLAFYSMGIAALLQHTHGESSFPLLKATKYLGGFGITHGTVEWLLMILIADIYPQYELIITELAILLNAISFAFLWVFGIKLFEYNEKVKKTLKSLPWIIFAGWLICYFIIPLVYENDIMSIRWLQSASGRYFLGFPGAVFTSVALFRNAKTMQYMGFTRVSYKIKGLAVLFAAYAILAGLVVRKINFFPANIINTELFRMVFGFPVELGRAVTAIGITMLFVGIIDVFKWETNKKIAILTEQQAASMERRKLGREMHDVVLQDLFVSGLQLENMIEDENCTSRKEDLISMKENLNNTISKIRGFLQATSSRKMEIEDLKYKLYELVHNFEKTYHMPIELDYEVPDITLGHLSPEKLTQIYYIVHEAINNAIKHGNATKITVTLNTTLKYVVAMVSDNGQGFDTNNMGKGSGYGLYAMRERAKTVKGVLEIESNEKGTVVCVSIPWEERHHGNEEH